MSGEGLRLKERASDATTVTGTVVYLSRTKAAQAARMGGMHVRISQGRNKFVTVHGDDDEKRRMEAAGARLALAAWHGGTLPLETRLHYSAQPGGSLIPATDEGIWWLVTGRCPSYKIIGWCRGDEREQLGTWRDDVAAGAWFVPQSRLRRPDEAKA